MEAPYLRLKIYPTKLKFSICKLFPKFQRNDVFSYRQFSFLPLQSSIIFALFEFSAWSITSLKDAELFFELCTVHTTFTDQSCSEHYMSRWKTSQTGSCVRHTNHFKEFTTSARFPPHQRHLASRIPSPTAPPAPNHTPNSCSTSQVAEEAKIRYSQYRGRDVQRIALPLGLSRFEKVVGSE